MPESQEREELGGLARSIDSLFSSGPAGANDSAGSDASVEESSSQDLDPDGALEAVVAPTESDPTSPEEPEQLALDALEDEPTLDHTDSDSDSGTEEIEMVEALDTSAESELDESASDDVDASQEAELVEVVTVVDEADAASDPATPEDEVAEFDSGAGVETGAVGLPASPDEAPESGPLAEAVESYLDGSGDADSVRAIVAAHLEAREFDAVAQAVEHLAYHSFAHDSAEPLELANELLTPLVRNRIVQRVGGERNEARRQFYSDVCTALGTDMAYAIRDELADASDRFARRAYFDVLIAMGDVSRPVIESMAGDDNRFLARNAVAILGEIGGARAVELVVGALANPDPRVRREALRSMARLKVEHADEIIVGRLVDDTDASVRLAATATVGELRIERAVRPLVAALDEAYETDEVLPLLHALGQIGDPGAVASIEKHAVRELFAKPRTEVRIAAYQALNHIGTPHARRLLNQAVSDKDPEVKAVVKDLLHMR